MLDELNDPCTLADGLTCGVVPRIGVGVSGGVILRKTWWFLRFHQILSWFLSSIASIVFFKIACFGWSFVVYCRMENQKWQGQMTRKLTNIPSWGHPDPSVLSWGKIVESWFRSLICPMSREQRRRGGESESSSSYEHRFCLKGNEMTKVSYYEAFSKVIVALKWDEITRQRG